ncbi:MAG: aspartate ammonia-lyase [Bacteroidales bacterium]
MDMNMNNSQVKTRKEHDFLGEREIPDHLYYGVQTLRALENFNISNIPLSFFTELIQGFAMVKEAAAMANRDLGEIDEKKAAAIIEACKEVRAGKFNDQFVVDMVQGGAGTSTNMNANEVISNRALEILGHQKGEYQFLHPNDDVNKSQSTNDAYPTAVKLALLLSNRKLISALNYLIEAFRAKAVQFQNVIKMGRTQLQDAVPMTLGQEFNAYANNLAEEIARLEQNVNLFLEVNMGATAIGTGIAADPDYSALCIKYLGEVSQMPVVAAPDFIEATNDTGAFVMYSSAVKRLAIKLSKICNDLRLLSSGPRTGLNEINLPPMQPGSSIMPGKVNPVIPEVVNQVAFKVIGNDLTVTFAAEAGQLELNVMEPIIVFSMFESLEMMVKAMNTLRDKCIIGITANEKHCKELVYGSIGIVTSLLPYLGYETCSRLARKAMETGKGVYDLILEEKLMPKDELEEILKPENMVRPQRIPKSK